MQSVLSELKAKNKTIGFVPTMGALHAGHISLVEESKKQNDFTIVSVFVNPTQFNNLEDLEKYPRTEQADAALLEDAGVDAVFFPSVEVMYPNGAESNSYDFNGLENQMEGKFRPGHFDGVGTIVKRFFEIVQPDHAYFGEKDFQQLRIIQQMVENYKIPLEIVPVEIKRDENGLAMSSRNKRLTEEMLEESPKIYQILLKAKDFLQNNSVEATKKMVEEEFAKTKLELEYIEIADEKTLESVTNIEPNQKIRAFIAAFAGDIRLIDNLRLN
ncbi:pantoate--beta-alanine ligase [Moheibacter stercoris]|uniref:Pantothenate synthetase n=2 Tax=Moheibacter stercoris TaxID=1628251 RepID=A0ABV2LSD4_9FLAO